MNAFTDFSQNLRTKSKQFMAALAISMEKVTTLRTQTKFKNKKVKFL